MDYNGPTKEVSEGNNISKWTRYHSCDILEKIVTFCPCPKNRPETKLKRFWTDFVGRGDFETSRQV